MKTLLIVENSEALTKTLIKALAHVYEVHTWAKGQDLLGLLEALRPEVLIINLSLPDTDGLTLLQRSAYTPPTTLALTYIINESILREAEAVGIRRMILLPARTSSIVRQLMEI